jgi:hypothetical protein
MLDNYKQFNEARKHKKKGGNKGGRYQPNQGARQPMKKYNRGDNEIPYQQQKIIRGMSMDYSPSFRYIITKIAEKNNRIAKELLEVLNKPEAKFEYSFLDLTNRGDTLSYLPNGERNTPDDSKYSTNKRQQSKVYKIIKTIFGSKYTKTDVNKFVSLFKQVYDEGPPEKSEVKSKKTVGQLLQNLIKDTKEGNLEWKENFSIPNVITFVSKIQVTNSKYIDFCFWCPNSDITKSFLTVNFKLDSKIVKSINSVKKGSIIDTKFSDGIIKSEVL